jgi:hypothetical protein
VSSRTRYGSRFTSWHTAHGRRLVCAEGHQRNRTVLCRWPSIIPADTPGAHGASSTGYRYVPLVTQCASHCAGVACCHRYPQASSSPHAARHRVRRTPSPTRVGRISREWEHEVARERYATTRMPDISTERFLWEIAINLMALEAVAQCYNMHRGLLRGLRVIVVVDNDSPTALRQKPFHGSAFWRRYWTRQSFFIKRGGKSATMYPPSGSVVDAIPVRSEHSQSPQRTGE